MSKKILAICLILSVLLCAFVSCDDKDKKKSGAKNKTSISGNEYIPDDVGPYSQGLAYEISSDRTYYKVKGVGSCTDTQISIPPTYEGLAVKEIGFAAFGATYLSSNSVSVVKEITIPNSVEKIGEGAFANNKYLTKIKFGGYVQSIANSAFRNCENITEVHIKSLEKWCMINFESWTSSPFYESKNAKLYLNNKLVEDVSINKATEIKQYAFYGCTTIKNVTLGDSVTAIGDGAFYNCDSLSVITIGKNVSKIGCNAFTSCDVLRNAVFKDPEKWYTLKVLSSSPSDIIEVPSSDLKNSNTAAQYVEETYTFSYWEKSKK